jgi:putative endonuclease
MARADAPVRVARAELGARAEALASDYLARQGLVLVARNFRTPRGEIDVIARDRDTLVFVEVRLRSRAAYGGAAASITPAKRARLLAAAHAYLATLAREPACRFDAILLDGLDPARIAWERNIIDNDD